MTKIPRHTDFRQSSAHLTSQKSGSAYSGWSPLDDTRMSTWVQVAAGFVLACAVALLFILFSYALA